LKKYLTKDELIDVCNRINENYLPTDKVYYEKIDKVLADTKLNPNEKLMFSYIELLKVIDKEIVSIENKVDVQASCNKGCFQCCYFPTILSGLEAKLLTEYILSLTTERKINILNHLSNYYAGNQDLLENACNIDFKTDTDYKVKYLSEKLQCPLLDPEDKSCMIYEARPSSCRTYVNYCSPTVCEESMIPEEPLSFEFMHEFYFDALNDLIQTMLQNGEEIINIDYPQDSYEYGYLPLMLAINLNRTK
jgi:Fe-S-cluster containining protein